MDCAHCNKVHEILNSSGNIDSSYQMNRSMIYSFLQVPSSAGIAGLTENSSSRLTYALTLPRRLVKQDHQRILQLTRMEIKTIFIV
ncbi:hypothetical protein Tsubulata_008673 [Turnera subulata]|uniref:Uncharacterized protein n=1 Tax=Turnera subulata TaxID=218843 RepID=A0A9Q0F5A8_9ROSI|nr:hypothetical protein Tsubulata_008673 [Turnera subulata]